MWQSGKLNVIKWYYIQELLLMVYINTALLEESSLHRNDSLKNSSGMHGMMETGWTSDALSTPVIFDGLALSLGYQCFPW